MGLTELWSKSREQLESKHVQQIIAFAGSGKLQDGNDASHEFRQFLSLVSSDFLVRYADECLSGRFDGNGLALQDIVNEVGRRLGFQVTHGRYRGVHGHIGYDGLWQSPENHAIVIEVKTTDAYRLDLDVVAGYRRALIRTGKIQEDHSSVLIVVGREDTGDLEAQIRGSRHAWDVRLMSVDSLLRLLGVKEKTEDPRIHQQIRSILIPREFTKLDGIIDIVFSATEDILEPDQAAEEPQTETAEASPEGGPLERKPKFTPVSFNDSCVERIQSYLGVPLVKRSRATFASPDGEVMLICKVSKEYSLSGSAAYWFAFHRHQKEALEGVPKAYVAFGCGSDLTIILIPFQDFVTWLDGMWTTDRETGSYWHVRIIREGGKFTLDRKKGYDPIDVTRYLLKVQA